MSSTQCLRTAARLGLLIFFASAWGEETPTITDRDFIEAIAQGGIAEVDAAKLATQRAQDQQVRKFAEHVLDEHSKANERLKALATDRKVILPTVPNSERITERKQLEAHDTANFDAEYVEKQVKEHERTVELLQNEIANGKDADIRRFAMETLPAVTRRLEAAKRLQSSLDGGKGERRS